MILTIWAVGSHLAVNKFALCFIQAGHPILTYYPSWSVVSSLRQPAAVGAGGFCAESNPAGGSGQESAGLLLFWK